MGEAHVLGAGVLDAAFFESLLSLAIITPYLSCFTFLLALNVAECNQQGEEMNEVSMSE